MPHDQRNERMVSMIDIDGVIVSTDILTEHFLCDLEQCKGICCVEGNSGAPLNEDEIEVLEKEWENYRDLMSEEGRKVIDKEGFYVVDDDGDLTTPLIGDADCAYSVTEQGVTYCAIEKAWKQGRCSFRKPVSCHLYPIRLRQFSNGTIGLNYHRWDVCQCAVACGRKNGVKIYQMLREAIERRFGAEFYDSLCQADQYLKTLNDETT